MAVSEWHNLLHYRRASSVYGVITKRRQARSLCELLFRRRLSLSLGHMNDILRMHMRVRKPFSVTL